MNTSLVLYCEKMNKISENIEKSSLSDNTRVPVSTVILENILRERYYSETKKNLKQSRLSDIARKILHNLNQSTLFPLSFSQKEAEKIFDIARNFTFRDVETVESDREKSDEEITRIIIKEKKPIKRRVAVKSKSSNYSSYEKKRRLRIKNENVDARSALKNRNINNNIIYNSKMNEDNNEIDCGIATLLNMGNTCFFNSVVYSLRFVPAFSHNLHHLFVDLCWINGKIKDSKSKTSSLGRTGMSVSGGSWRSASSKDLVSIGNSDSSPKSKDQIVAEALHALFVALTNLESKKNLNPYQPERLLRAIRDANPFFEGNHQQDAHEFLVGLFSCLRLTSDKVKQQIEQNPELLYNSVPTSGNLTNGFSLFGAKRSEKKILRQKGEINYKKLDGSEDNVKKMLGYNFIEEEFQGISLQRTKCLECETNSEMKEPFLEIQVPINCNEDSFLSHTDYRNIFKYMCVTTEKLEGPNKYFCENCKTYTEAQRTLHYEKVPNNLVFHLKRFTTTQTGIQKVTTFVPTPLEIRCFCETCLNKSKSNCCSASATTTHHQYLLNCVIIHLGSSMASGHYMAYTRAFTEIKNYADCTRDFPKNNGSLSSTKEFTNFMKSVKTKTMMLMNNTDMNNDHNISSSKINAESQMCQSISCCGVHNYNLDLKVNNRLVNSNQLLNIDDWLEFDDEKVRVLTQKDFIKLLNKKHDTTNTPYLLFYSKII